MLLGSHYGLRTRHAKVLLLGTQSTQLAHGSLANASTSDLVGSVGPGRFHGSGSISLSQASSSGEPGRAQLGSSVGGLAHIVFVGDGFGHCLARATKCPGTHCPGLLGLLGDLALALNVCQRTLHNLLLKRVLIGTHVLGTRHGLDLIRRIPSLFEGQLSCLVGSLLTCTANAGGRELLLCRGVAWGETFKLTGSKACRCGSGISQLLQICSLDVRVDGR